MVQSIESLLRETIHLGDNALVSCLDPRAWASDFRLQRCAVVHLHRRVSLGGSSRTDLAEANKRDMDKP